MTKVLKNKAFSFKKIHENVIIFKHHLVQFFMFFLLVYNNGCSRKNGPFLFQNYLAEFAR